MNTRQGLSTLLLGMVTMGCAPSAAEQEDTPDEEGGGYTFPVTFVPMAAGTVQEISEFSGDVASKRRGHLAFERGGRIVEMAAEEGDAVEEGQLLARLESSVLEAELEAARALQSAAEVQREYAERELKRYEGMADAAADVDRDQWRHEVALRSSTEVQRAAESKRLENLFAQSELRAPFAGTLVARSLTVGSFATPGGSVFEIVDLANREIRIELPQDMASGIRPGTEVEVRSPALPGGRLTAALGAILPATRSSARTFTGLVPLDKKLDPDRLLLPGSYVLVRLLTRQASAETIVPADALVDSGFGWAVVVAEGEDPPTARFVPVRILASDGTRIAVEPLEPGALATDARVVVTGTDNIFPGAPLLLHAHRDPSSGGDLTPTGSSSEEH